jgi:hypothetical protein
MYSIVVIQYLDKLFVNPFLMLDQPLLQVRCYHDSDAVVFVLVC